MLKTRQQSWFCPSLLGEEQALPPSLLFPCTSRLDQMISQCLNSMVQGSFSNSRTPSGWGDIERAFLRQEGGGRQGWSQPPGGCQNGLQRVQVGGQADRQGAKGTRKGWPGQGRRHQGPNHPTSQLHFLPCWTQGKHQLHSLPCWTQGKHIQCVLGG